jgi:hypothetical protein
MSNKIHSAVAQDAALLKNPMKVNGGQIPKTPISTGSKAKPSSVGSKKS